MDYDWLKNCGKIFMNQYFEVQLGLIREISISKRKFYRKITDIYTTSIDYDAQTLTTHLFFVKVQNKLKWVIHGQTVVEGCFTYHLADIEKEHMGLNHMAGCSSW